MERREWIEKFEMINDRKPTVAEMEEAEQAGEFETVIERKIQAEVAKAMKPTFKDKVLSFFSSIAKFSFKALMAIFLAPVTLVFFVFSFLKNLVFFWIVWFMCRPLFVFIAEGISMIFSKNPQETALYKTAVSFFFGSPQAMTSARLIPERDIDWIFILLGSALFAFLTILPSTEKE